MTVRNPPVVNARHSNSPCRYRCRMAPSLDVHVWIDTDDRSSVLSRFFDQYLAPEQTEPRFEAFRRSMVDGHPGPGDAAALAELNRDAEPTGAFSIYLHAARYEFAMVTITDEGALVLGLSIDVPDGSPAAAQQAEGERLMESLIQRFGGSRGVAGVELAPAQSRSEWDDEAMVLWRQETA